MVNLNKIKQELSFLYYKLKMINLNESLIIMIFLAENMVSFG